MTTPAYMEPDIITSSPGYLAWQHIVRTRFVGTNVPLEPDIAHSVNPDTMKLEIIYEWLDFLEVPDTRIFGEDFTRNVFRGLFDMFSGRDRRSAIDALADAAFFTWELLPWGKDANGKRNHMNICITPSPLVGDRVDLPTYLEFVSRWIKWLQPHFDPNITINICFGPPIQKIKVNTAVRPVVYLAGGVFGNASTG